MAPGAQKWGLGIPQFSLEKMMNMWFCSQFFFKKKYGYESKPWYLVNPKIAGKWMFIPLKMVLIGIDPYPYIYIYIGSRLIAWFIFYSIFIGVVFRQVVIRWAAGRLSPWLPFWSGFSVFRQWRVYKFPRLVDGSAHMIGRFVSETFKFPWNPKLFVE